MKTKANTSLIKANEIIAHISGDKPLTKSEITNYSLDIRNALSELVDYLSKEELRKIKSKSIKTALIERLEFKRMDEYNLELHALKSSRVIRELKQVNQKLSEQLMELQSQKQLVISKAMSDF